MVDDVASEAADEMAVFLDKLYETSKQFIDMDNIQVNKLMDEHPKLHEI